MVQCTVHTDGGRGPTSERAWLRGASSARSSKTLPERWGGRSVDSGLAAGAVVESTDGGAGAGTPCTWTRGRAQVGDDVRGATARLRPESQLDSPFHLLFSLSSPLSACWEIPGGRLIPHPALLQSFKLLHCAQQLPESVVLTHQGKDRPSVGLVWEGFSACAGGRGGRARAAAECVKSQRG